MVRAFRRAGGSADTWRSEDWLGSCVAAAGTDVAGGDGLSTVTAGDGSSVTLRDVLAQFGGDLLGPGRRVRQDRPEVLVKLVSAATRVPLHAHPGRAFAGERLGSPFGKTEAWVVLATDNCGGAPYVGVGFVPGVGRAELADLIRRQDHAGFDAALVRRAARAGEVYLIPAGTPHFFGPGLLVLNVQEPSDHTVLAEWDGASTEPEARIGLDWDTALDAFEFEPGRTPRDPAEALQAPTRLRGSAGGAEFRLVGPAADEFFDVTRLEISEELPVDDGRFYVGVVTEGRGWLSFEGSSQAFEGGSQALERGDAFVCPASLPHRFARAGSARFEVTRCLEAPRSGGS